MKFLKIQIAFLSQQSNNNSNLRIGRIDHATIVKIKMRLPYLQVIVYVI